MEWDGLTTVTNLTRWCLGAKILPRQFAPSRRRALSKIKDGAIPGWWQTPEDWLPQHRQFSLGKNDQDSNTYVMGACCSLWPYQIQGAILEVYTSGEGVGSRGSRGVRSSLVRSLEVLTNSFFIRSRRNRWHYCKVASRPWPYIAPWISLELSAPHVILDACCVLIGQLEAWRLLRGGLAAGVNVSVRASGFVSREMTKTLNNSCEIPVGCAS